MSKCDVNISTQATNYKIGETVKGKVTIEVDKECQCDKLILQKYWSTHGKGNRASGVKEELNLFQGTWQPGKYEYPFSFVLNDGPFSYHGHYINVDWYLNAQADIPWSIDPKDEIEYILEKSDTDQTDSLPAYEFHNKQSNTLDLNKYPLLRLFPLIFVIAGILMIYFQGDLFIGGVFTIVGTVIFYKLIQSSIAERKLGKVKCELLENILRPGDDLHFSISFEPASNVTINTASVRLVGKEVAISGSGTNTTTHSHTFHSEEMPILMQGSFSGGMPVRDKRRLKVPAGAAASFTASDNRLEWQLVVNIDIPKWPDWENSLSITVLP